ncbi:MAG: DUF1015 domain-containing protein [Pseudomonadota bacterium]
MPLIKAFNGYLVKPARATTVVSPAYDSVSAEQRRQFAEANPDNFINTMRLQEDFAEDQRPTYEQLLTSNHQQLQQLLDNGSFDELPEPSMFVYQLGSHEHLQTGIVCEVSVEEYENGHLKKHENTRSSKEDLLARYQEVVGASSSPICLTYASSAEVDAFINELMQQPPILDFTTDDGEVQRVWQIKNPTEQQVLQQLFEAVGDTYLTDGHHRAASGQRYAELMRRKNGNNDSNAPHNQLLVALFPDNQLNLLPFHRCVKDLNGLTLEQLIEALDSRFNVEAMDDHCVFQPQAHGQFGMCVANRWFKLTHRKAEEHATSPVNSLDVSILQNDILDPILGIKDMRDDSRLGYIAGVSGDSGIAQTCSEGWEVVFTCYATSIQQLMDVADANALMPPKSTYFDPKPRSGIFVRLK